MRRADYLGKQFFKRARLTNSSICYTETHSKVPKECQDTTSGVGSAMCQSSVCHHRCSMSTENTWTFFFPSVGALVLAHVRISSHQGGYFSRVLGVTFCFYQVWNKTSMWVAWTLKGQDTPMEKLAFRKHKRATLQVRCFWCPLKCVAGSRIKDWELISKWLNKNRMSMDLAHTSGFSKFNKLKKVVVRIHRYVQ